MGPAIKPHRKKPLRQIAALPLRTDANGALEVMLVTTRQTQRWVIPKGWPWLGLPGHQSAAGEAWEEAGIKGQAYDTPVGTFTYLKNRQGRAVMIEVTVYRLDVTEVFDTWPEEAERQRAWFTPQAAGEVVNEPGLKSIIQGLGNQIAA